MSKLICLTFGVTVALGLSACQTTSTVDQHTQALTLSNQSLAARQAQSRRFDTNDESKMLNACIGVLQDLGFILTESASRPGVLVASKDRRTGGAFWTRNQKIRVAVVTTPFPPKAVRVRVTFQRVIWTPNTKYSKVETIHDPLIYREFFDKLSQSVFLEAHQL